MSENEIRKPKNLSNEAFRLLKDALQVMAASAQTQIDTLTRNVVIADEIVLDFDAIYDWVKGDQKNLSVDVRVNPNQEKLLDEIREYITKMSDRDDPDLWSEEALFDRQEWQVLRILAEKALIAFDWPRFEDIQK